ncbi:MAG: hypothetical protein AAFV53_33065 [Myxococcota bacterium]
MSGLLLVVSTALAWDTVAEDAGLTGWEAMYVRFGLVRNEHESLLDEALTLIDPLFAGKWGYASEDDDRLTLVDLNASWYRMEQLAGETLIGDDPQTAHFEERLLPRLTVLAGLPDVSYSLTDWINKNTICTPNAAMPGVGVCHSFAGWMGGLNATHFGALAVRMYDRHHQLALEQAAVAGALYTAHRDAGTLDLHRDKIKEAELLALMYEAIGHHYLQDRWASGHMWNRWGSGDMDNHSSVEEALTVGSIAGIVHGTFAITGVPDPMSFPYTGPSDEAAWAVGATRWRFLDGEANDGVFHDGVGDEVLETLRTSIYDNQIFALNAQHSALMTCASGGLRQVISRFGFQDGQYGANKIRMTMPAGLENAFPELTRFDGFNPARAPECTSHWVSNRSYYIGINTALPGPGLLTRTSGPDDATPQYTRLGPTLAQTQLLAYAYFAIDPNGTESAQIGPPMRLNGRWIEPNNIYDVPKYLETSIAGLPSRAENGVDLHTIDGLFRHADPARTCASGLEGLGSLRAAAVNPSLDAFTRDTAAAVCALEAEKYYEIAGISGVEVAGDSFVDFEGQPIGEDYQAYCLVSAPDMRQQGRYSDDTNPSTLHPGYVGTVDQRDAADGVRESLLNWCRQVPVLDPLSSSEEAIYRVGRLDHLDADRYVPLSGRHLGFKTTSGAVGTVEMQDEAGTWGPIFVFDSADGEGAGWGDTFTVNVRVPLASQGFPSHATSGMRPDEIKAVGARDYPLRLSRAIDPEAAAIFLADGASTARDAILSIEPSWVELDALSIRSDTRAEAFWVITPEDLEDEITVLALGFFERTPDGRYQEIDVPFVVRYGQQPSVDAEGNITWARMEDILGVAIDFEGTGTSPTALMGEVSLFYAYH